MVKTQRRMRNSTRFNKLNKRKSKLLRDVKQLLRDIRELKQKGVLNDSNIKRNARKLKNIRKNTMKKHKLRR